ncbi:MAG: PEGA domain-containing protein [Polyangiaceae bacterium]|nr:PEGA domain-containing protein [Polyangiaceae bacterium]
MLTVANTRRIHALERSLAACLCALVLAFAGVARAQPTEPQPPAPPTAPVPAEPPPAAAPAPPPAAEAKEYTPEQRQEALGHFKKGLALLEERAFAPALAEFMISRSIFPTAIATRNAAAMLRALQRYDEAVEMFETLLREFNVPPGEEEGQRGWAQKQVSELRGLVGTVDVFGAEPGAAIVVSGEAKGEYPPVQPIRVPAGTHVVRVFKEGFEPYETRIDVAGGQTASVQAKLRKLADSGRLRVSERSGKSLEVLVDGVTMGKTPWEGVLGVGDHMVVLRGEGKLGTQPAAAAVKSQQTTQLALSAEDLDATLRVDPTPPGASVAVDGVTVGNGVWLGRMRIGKHTVEVRSDGFLTATKEMTLARGQRENLAIELERDEDAPVWRVPPKWVVDVSAGLAVVPSFGGDIGAACESGCQRSIGLGATGSVSASYELGSGLGFGLELGYLFAWQEVRGRKAALLPHGFATPNSGEATDSLRLSAFLGGLNIGYHFEGDVPVALRLGAGALVGQLRDERVGAFLTQDGSGVATYPVVDFQRATYFYVDPQVRVGFRFEEHFELSAFVQALLLVGIEVPKWDSSLELAAGSDGIGTYPEESLLGSFIVAVTPGLNFRGDF